MLALTLALTSCSGADTTHEGTQAAGDTKVPPARVTIAPQHGEKDARPDKDVVVNAAGGTLQRVSVIADGETVKGEFNKQRTQWRSKWTLKPDTKYTVNAVAANSVGAKSQATSAFKTLEPDNTISVDLQWILEKNQGDTYGVGLPIILIFDRPVRNKERVERALEVTAEKPVPGAWRWIGNQKVVYRTKEYWPAHQTVTLNARLAGVRAAKNVYGTKDFTRTFKIGERRITEVDMDDHEMVVTVDGKKAREVPISGGNGTTLEYTTSSGVHLTMEKGNPVRMVAPGREKGDPGYYDLLINYAVRISSSGEYLHQTAGETWCLGKRNCSHGCVRQPPKDAQWFYKNVQPGDVVDIKGTRRDLDWQNGWSFWQLSWEKWKKGSALD